MTFYFSLHICRLTGSGSVSPGVVRSLIPVAIFPFKHPSICGYSGSIDRLDIARSTGFHVFRADSYIHWVQDTVGAGCNPSCSGPVGTGIGIPLFCLEPTYQVGKVSSGTFALESYNGFSLCF